MKLDLVGCAMAAALVLSGCGDKTNADSSANAASSSSKPAPAKSASAGSFAATASASAEKLDSAGLEKVADSVTFTQASDKDGTFSGKLANASTHAISGLEYDAFAYGKDSKLIERIEGKLPAGLGAGASSDIQVGPFKGAAGKDGVTVEVVVSWMNVDGTSFQRPVPKDRAKGGPNNMLKK
jgi:hypothetical protein